MAVAYSPDGRTILTAGDYKTARLWDAATLSPIGQPSISPRIREGGGLQP